VQRRVRSVALQLVRPTLGISCERPICSTLVCFIPLFDAVVILRPCRFWAVRKVGGCLALSLLPAGKAPQVALDLALRMHT
jgi:hypothetical protein